VTSGDWQVREIVRIDEPKRLLWFEGTKDGATGRHLHDRRLVRIGSAQTARSTASPHCSIAVALSARRATALATSVFHPIDRHVRSQHASTPASEMDTRTLPDDDVHHGMSVDITTISDSTATHTVRVRSAIYTRAEQDHRLYVDGVCLLICPSLRAGDDCIVQVPSSRIALHTCTSHRVTPDICEIRFDGRVLRATDGSALLVHPLTAVEPTYRGDWALLPIFGGSLLVRLDIVVAVVLLPHNCEFEAPSAHSACVVIDCAQRRPILD
jgi:hypothetical protein